MSKISAYTELAEAPASTDEFVIVDKSDTSMAATGTTKRIQAQYITIPDASETVKGKVELATNAETITGTDTVRAVTPANITAKMDTDGTLSGNSDTRIPSQKAVKTYVDSQGGDTAPQNLLKNGNFINNSSNGYGSTPDDWTSSNANPVQGGIPALTKQNLIDILGVADGDIEGLWNLNGDFTDKSSNVYDLTSSGSPTDSSDGLMSSAKTFSSASSQHAVKTTPTNLLISGAQTWIAFVKPTSVTGSKEIMAHSDSGVTVYGLLRNESGKAFIQLSGLTTNTSITSDVTMQTGKWYMVVGVFDPTNTKLKIWVNGIKKEVTSSGTHTTSGTQSFAVSRLGASASNYFDGSIQNASILSVALSDDQVKRLFASTMYKGQKIRRATTNGYIYQDLPMNLVERLRGRTVALRADMYQDTASTGQISILQTLASGSTSETIISATDATTGSWLEKYASGTIDATAVGIRIQLKHSTFDGNTWFRRVSVYEGSTLLPYDNSKDDWSRFPRLLWMDIPSVLTAYQFEENRFYHWTPVWTGFSSGPTNQVNRFLISGKRIICRGRTDFGTSNSTSLTTTLPAVVGSSTTPANYYIATGRQKNNSVLITTGVMEISSNSATSSCYRDGDGTSWTNVGTKGLDINVEYEID